MSAVKYIDAGDIDRWLAVQVMRCAAGFVIESGEDCSDPIDWAETKQDAITMAIDLYEASIAELVKRTNAMIDAHNDTAPTSPGGAS